MKNMIADLIENFLSPELSKEDYNAIASVVNHLRGKGSISNNETKLLEERSVLKKALDNRDAKIASLSEDVSKWQQICAVKDKNAKKLADEVEELKAERNRQAQVISSQNKVIADQRTALSKARHQRDQLSGRLDPLSTLKLQIQLSEALQEAAKYKSALSDLGGSLCASSDHSKELAEAIHKILLG